MILPGRQEAMLEDGLGDSRNDDEAREGDQHCNGAEGEILLPRLFVVERIVNGGRHSYVWLSSCRGR